ncbi:MULTISPECIES: ferredoxin [unclassified Streptomyces]|uniref:ferredoxin n=1 Tax=unclassified Streptomyces TaxID=2593676 RepID=UPI002237D2BD|nr:ferredoxin [Streptomyces sp. SHP 1-2]MCW5253190.1 ferredoxin [Streptomyces sp. SHP 1-2]
MKAHVDATRCQGMGVCAEICPSVFLLDDWGFASAAGDGSVSAADETAVRDAAARCPEKAISLSQ